MFKKRFILALCLFMCVGISWIAADNKRTDKPSREDNSIIETADNKGSFIYAGLEQGDDDEVNFTFDEVESKKIKNGFVLDYEGFDGTCTWLMLESTHSVKEVLNIAINNNSDDIKLYLVSSDNVSKELSIGQNKINMKPGNYRIKITGNKSSNKLELKYSKKSTLIIKMNKYFNMGYEFDEEDSQEDAFSKLFKNMINTNDIKSIDEITDEMILNKEGAYFDHSSKKNNGDCLELDYKGFTGIFRWCSLEAKKKASITVHVKGTIDESIRLVLIQNDKSVQDIKDGDKITLDKGKSRIVLCGYKGEGSLKLSFTYDKKKISISDSEFKNGI